MTMTERRDYSPHVLAGIAWAYTLVIIVGAFTWGPWWFVFIALLPAFLGWMVTDDLLRGNL